jgi:hypothetical protein
MMLLSGPKSCLSKQHGIQNTLFKVAMHVSIRAGMIRKPIGTLYLSFNCWITFRPLFGRLLGRSTLQNGKINLSFLSKSTVWSIGIRTHTCTDKSRGLPVCAISQDQEWWLHLDLFCIAPTPWLLPANPPKLLRGTYKIQPNFINRNAFDAFPLFKAQSFSNNQIVLYLQFDTKDSCSLL